MRKLAREAEMEEEDPDKFYKEIDESQAAGGRGRRGRGGRGRARGRGRGRGAKVASELEAPVGGEDVQASEVASPCEVAKTDEDADEVARGAQDEQDGAKRKLVRSGSKRLRRLRSRKRWVLRKAGSKSLEFVEIDDTPKKASMAAPSLEEDSAQEDKSKEPKQERRKSAKKSAETDKKREDADAKQVKAKALLGFYCAMIPGGWGQKGWGLYMLDYRVDSLASAWRFNMM